jgi:hypothetical protein
MHPHVLCCRCLGDFDTEEEAARRWDEEKRLQAKQGPVTNKPLAVNFPAEGEQLAKYRARRKSFTATAAATPGAKSPESKEAADGPGKDEVAGGGDSNRSQAAEPPATPGPAAAPEPEGPPPLVDNFKVGGVGWGCNTACGVDSG